MNDIQAFFFDFDGVLADSVEVKTRAFAELFKPYGPEVLSLVIDHHRKHGGMTRVDKFRYYYQAFVEKPLDDEELADLCRRFSELVVDEVVASPEIGGARDFLKRWHALIPCFVISAAPEEEVQEIVRRRGLSLYFKEVRGAPVSKKNNFGAIISRYNLYPEKCLFFGDAESDYQVARSWGINFWAILPGPKAPLLKVAPKVKWARDFREAMRMLSTNHHQPEGFI